MPSYSRICNSLWLLTKVSAECDPDRIVVHDLDRIHIPKIRDSILQGEGGTSTTLANWIHDKVVQIPHGQPIAFDSDEKPASWYK